LNLPDQLNSESARRNLHDSSTSRRTPRKEDSYDCPVIPFDSPWLSTYPFIDEIYWCALCTCSMRKKKSVSLKHLCEKT